MKKYTYYVNEGVNGQFNMLYSGIFTNLNDCMNELMRRLFLTLGNGDGENGGVGSLWRCAKEIYDTIASGKKYSYANYEFYITVYEEQAKEDKVFGFEFSAVVDNYMTICAKNYEEAKKEYNARLPHFIKDLKECVKKSRMDWDYDGNINGCKNVNDEGSDCF